jgi:hypothetical protein
LCLEHGTFSKFSAAGATQKILLKEPLGNSFGTFYAINQTQEKRRASPATKKKTTMWSSFNIKINF